MKRINQEELNKIFDLHEQWLKDNTKGRQMFLDGYDLRGLDFYKIPANLVAITQSDLRDSNFLECVKTALIKVEL